MAGCPPEDEVLDLIEARRALTATPELEAHLDGCSRCRALIHAVAHAAPQPDLVGHTLGPYRLDALIGVGGMGEVYRGWDQRLARHVAVKVLTRRAGDVVGDRALLATEARAAAAIAHPNVVTIYDVGAEGDRPYIVSELVTGELVRTLLARGPIPRATAIELAVQLARGLGAAHAQGVIHRDLKPENLIVTDTGTLKILDFGLAKIGREPDAIAGAAFGTPGYLAPEQARGESGDARSDVFAFGAIVHELLSGSPAFPGATVGQRLRAVAHDPPPLDDPAAAIVARCLDQEPRRRFQSADDLAWALDGVRTPPPAPTPTVPARSAISRRTFVGGIAAAGVAGAVLGRGVGRRPSPGLRPDYRQLTFRQGRVASVRFTGDGDSVLYTAAWDDLPLSTYLARRRGGGTRRLELPPSQLLAVSSRGQLALSLDHRYVEGFHHEGRLALAPLEGGAPRELGVTVQHADFTPDGAELAIVRRGGGRFRLELPINRVLHEAGWISHPRISPDGAWIACLVHDAPTDDAGALMLVARADGAQRPIGPGWSSIDGLAWARDGRSLWISGSRQGGNNIVRNLGLDGRERAAVPSVARLRVHDVAPDGVAAVTQLIGRLRMMARAPDAGVEHDLSLSDVSLACALSGDGESLLFAEYGDVDTAYGAYLRSSRGGPPQLLGQAWPFDLAEDGRAALALQYGRVMALVEYPVPSGGPRPIALTGVDDVRAARFAADGALVVQAAEPGRPQRLWRRAVDGTVAALTAEGVAGAVAISPDGHHLALIVDGRLQLIALTASTPPRVVPGAFPDQRVCGWHHDGAVLVHDLAAAVRVRRVDTTTGDARELFSIAPPVLGLRGVHAVVVNRAGTAYAYSYGQELSRLHTMTIAG